MRAKEIRERSDEEMRALHARMVLEMFRLRQQNFTFRLTKTSEIRKARRDIARVKTVIRDRARRAAGAAGGGGGGQ